jgi:hypothetical protein
MRMILISVSRHYRVLQESMHATNPHRSSQGFPQVDITRHHMPYAHTRMTRVWTYVASPLLFLCN